MHATHAPCHIIQSRRLLATSSLMEEKYDRLCVFRDEVFHEFDAADLVLFFIVVPLIPQLNQLHLPLILIQINQYIILINNIFLAFDDGCIMPHKHILLRPVNIIILQILILNRAVAPH